MGINNFFYILIVVTLSTLFVSIDDKDLKENLSDQPFVIIENSSVYSVNTSNTDQIIRSKLFTKYANKEILIDSIILKRINEDKYLNHLITSKEAIRMNNIITLKGDVKYSRDINLLLNTDNLIYNEKTKVITNNDSFYGVYNNNKVKGKNIYIDSINNIIKADEVNFNIRGAI